jgi:hypothetical protein
MIAFAQPPSKQQVVSTKATFTGTLTELTTQARKMSNGTDWFCEAKVVGDGRVEVKWYGATVIYTGTMGPAGGKAGAPLSMNAEGTDKSQVRFQWNSADEMTVEWWPNMAEKAGQTQHKPAHARGTLRKK